MGLYWWEFVNDWVVWVGGFLFDGQSVSDGLFHGGGGGILVAKVVVMGG